MIQMNFTKQKQTHRHRKQTMAMVIKGGEGINSIYTYDYT